MMVTLLMLTILAGLLSINMISGGRQWFLPVGLPAAVISFILTGLMIIIYRRARLKGLNIIASALIHLAGLCIFTELILDWFLYRHINLNWSLIVAVSILPVSMVLFYTHYRMKRGNRLDSIFHV